MHDDSLAKILLENEPLLPHITARPEYHPPVVGAKGTFRGKTWKDMPGRDSLMKKINFFMFRRGLYEEDAFV